MQMVRVSHVSCRCLSYRMIGANSDQVAEIQYTHRRCMSTVAHPHHPRKRADSHLACELNLQRVFYRVGGEMCIGWAIFFGGGGDEIGPPCIFSDLLTSSMGSPLLCEHVDGRRSS